MKPVTPILLAFASLFAAGCSEAFDPFVESEQVFALYGFLDARQDTQFVRVQPITDQETSAVDARVTSTALATGQTTVWQDSLVQLDDGTTGTVFYAAFRPESGGAYRIEASRADMSGASSVAELTIPAEPPLRVAEPNLLGGIITQLLTLDSAVRPENVRVTYIVRRIEGDEPIGFSFEYVAGPATSGAAFEVLVSLLRDAGTIRSVIGVEPEDTERVVLLDLRVAYDLVDEQRGDITGGLGTVGAAASFVTEWALDPEFVEAIGFVDGQDGEGTR